MSKAEREKYEKEEAEKHLKEMEEEALMFDDDNDNDNATATTRGRTTLGSSVFLAEQDWNSEEDDLSEYESDDDDYDIDISRVKLDQGYERESSATAMTESSDAWGSKPSNQRTTEEIETGKDEDYEKDTGTEEQEQDRIFDATKENRMQDKDGLLTGSQITVDHVLTNRRLHAVAYQMTGEEDRMDYEITPGQSGGVWDQSEKVQEKAAATPYINQYHDFEYGPSQYEHAQIRAKNLQYFISNQRTMRQISDGGVTQGGPSSNILLMTDGKPPGHDVTEVQQNYPPQHQGVDRRSWYVRDTKHHYRIDPGNTRRGGEGVKQ
jgi:hypothetical protein